jgi:nuclear cap-binding protein subunit 2
LFEKCGHVKRVIMGLNRVKRTPCGFCFVEFETHRGAGMAVNLLSGTVLDDRGIRVDWDAGFVEGRQFGRGQTGDQWRDDLRDDFDPARGGQGRALLRSLEDGSQIFVGQREGGSDARGGRGGSGGRWGHRGGGYKRPYEGQQGGDGDYKRQR